MFTLAPSLSLAENSNQNVKRKVFASPPFHLPEHTETYCVLCARLSVGSLVGGIRSCQRWSRCCSISSRQCSPTLLPTFSTCALETTRSSQRYGPFRYTHTHTTELWAHCDPGPNKTVHLPAVTLLIWRWECSWMQSNKCGCVLSREWVAAHELQHFCNLEGDSVGNWPRKKSFELSYNQISIYCKDIWNHFIRWFLSFYELLWREAVSWSSFSIAVTTWMDLCWPFTHPATLKDSEGRNYPTRPCIGGHHYVHSNIYYFMKSIENKHYRGYVIISIISNNNINDWKGKCNETVPLLLHHVVIITMIIKLYCGGVDCVSLQQCSLYYYFSTLSSGSLLKGSSPFQISIGALLSIQIPL